MAFDIDEYTASAHRVRDDDIDYDAFREHPLSADALRALRYFSNVETHTICYLRDLLVTPSHKDPDVTAFLTMWAFEEHWHGDALDKVLRVHGERVGADQIRDLRLAQGISDRISPIVQAIAANALGEDFVAVHMTIGAINEWSAHAAYGQTMAREPHPVLGKLLSRIQKQETRHLAFYAHQARERLERSAWARKLTRFAMRNIWTPVGSSIQSREETAFVMRYLMGGSDGSKAVARIDEKVDRFPGLDGLQPVATAVAQFGVGPLAGVPQPTLRERLRDAGTPLLRAAFGTVRAPASS